MPEHFDVIVIGGSAAGLSAALILGRSRRSVLVVDSGEPRNAPAAGAHNYLGHEGVAPAELIRIGRDEDPDPLVADLPPVAERAVHDPAPPLLGQARDLGQDVHGAGGHDQPACRDDRAGVQRDREPDRVVAVTGRGGRGHDPPGRDLDAVGGDLVATDADQLGGRDALVAEVVVCAGRRGVPRFAGVDDEHRAP